MLVTLAAAQQFAAAIPAASFRVLAGEERDPQVIELLRPSLCDEKGVWTADHIRLRFVAERAA